jgi:superfamily II DNA or RNA helicase
MRLREYQEECVKAVEDAFNEFKRVLVVMATGLGKTVVFNSLAKDRIVSGGRVLVLAHREELLQQAADKMVRFNGIEGTIIKADAKVDMNSMFYVASVQSMCKEDRLNQFPKDYFSMIICDEAHHAMADTYQRVFNYFENCNVLGVTATPSRSDQKKLSAFFQTTAFEYDLEDAIRDGWLSDVIGRTANIEVDLSKVRTVAGDFVVNELDNAIIKNFRGISRYIKNNLMTRKKILIFTPRVASAELLSIALKKEGLAAEFVCGESKNREEILLKYNRGEIQVLCNSLLLTEGFDEPEIDCVINLRPTQSNTLFKQMIGRGTRPHANKDNVLVVDFLWKTDREVINPCSLFAKNDTMSTAMRDFLVMHVNNSYDLSKLSSYVDMVMGGLHLMEGARRTCKEELSKRCKNSPAVFAFIINNKKILEYEPIHAWEMMPPTIRQIDFLEQKCNISCKKVNKGLASKLIDAIVKRIEKQKCTVKQMFLLARSGIFDKAPDISMEEAREIIDAIANNNWIIPSDMLRKYGGKKRLETPLINIEEMAIEPVEEGQRECAMPL